MRYTLRLRYISSLLRLLPVGCPGKARLGRFLLNSFLEQQKDLLITDRFCCKYMIPSFTNIIGFHLLIDGVYEPLTMKLLTQYLKGGSVFVDVGASIGIFSIPVAKLFCPNILVLAIEASPTMFSYLTKNIELNGLVNVRLKNCGVGEYDSFLPFYEESETHFGWGSFLPRFHNHPITVHVQPLDRILFEEKINHVDVIKVDVEGFEASVFAGAHHILTGARPPIILFESCNDTKGQEILLGYGYKLWRLRDFLSGQKPLNKILKSEFEMFVAKKY